MTPDPQRLQYLEAMGIAAWTSRYRFVNARATEQGEWQPAGRPAQAAPGERLHALLEDAQRAPAAPPAEAVASADPSPTETKGPTGSESVPATSRVRALLGDQTPETSPATAAADDSEIVEAREPEVLADPLRFSLSLGVIGERWWLMLPGERALSPQDEALLCQLLQAAGLPPRWRAVATLDWPLMATRVADPAGEAREGIQVFCAGQAQRNGLSIDGAIVVEGDAAWQALLERDYGSSESVAELDFATFRWPHPADLRLSAAAKRAAWQRLQSASAAWRDLAPA
ncbi:hypothetical protein [Salinicola avicenniae]|uniref:hypothetical protein n=1 Tax=Salinicola avicenniae TaxID=2916836 RepID=UPI002073C554|nr:MULTISPECIES: hypothetical protein [unclassified Salinicola]